MQKKDCSPRREGAIEKKEERGVASYGTKKEVNLLTSYNAKNGSFVILSAFALKLMQRADREKLNKIKVKVLVFGERRSS